MSKRSKLEIIDEILNNKFKDFSRKLIEENTDTKQKRFKMERKIFSKNINYSLYRYDPSNTEIFPYFTDKKGLKKICDYIMFIEDNKFLHVLLIELKKGKDSAKMQLEASKVFAEYIIKTIKRLKYDFDIENENIHYKLVVIKESKSKKKPINKKLETNNGIITHNNYKNFMINDYLDFTKIESR